ncbi:MAG: glycosyltransferase family 39 protein [Acidobacteria bacterium]|nr:glycosyltransferase family 39 protein [Acidobacteriota bacterium]
MLAWIVTHAVFTALLAAISLGVGRAIVNRWLPASPLELAISAALGLGILGEALFLLAAAGLLTRVAVFLIVAIAAIVAIFGLRGARPRLPWIALGALPSFVLALYPPTGFDATMYHLPFARLFVENHRLAFADTLRFPLFPQHGEVLFAGAMLVMDDVAAQLTQWLALVITTMAIAAIARELAGERAGSFAVALWIGTPLALYLGANAYIDVSLAMFVTLAFAAWLEWKRTAHLGFALLAGAFAGFAASTKYHGLFFIVVLFVAIAWRNRRAAAAFALVAMLIAAPWYVRIWAGTGNPLFPYFSAIFGRHEWQTNIDKRMEATAAHPLAAPAIVDPVRRAILDRIAEGSAPHSPWLLLLSPFAVLAAIRERRLRFPLAMALFYALVVSPLDWRFMIAAVPIAAVGIAVGLKDLRYAAIVTLLLALPGIAWTTLLLAKYGPIPSTQAQRDAFLARRIAVYDALAFLRRDRPVVYILDAEYAAYYSPARCLGEHYGPYRYAKLRPLLADPPRLARQLNSWGVHVLVIDREKDRFAPNAHFRRVFSGGRAEAFEVILSPSS